jgi:H+-translocating NAD(P) transhydrogenase subunit beta
MSVTLSTVAYLGAVILFILSLGGLSNPETSRRGNLYGMVGMAIAVLATIFGPQVTTRGYGFILAALVVGAAIGLYAARVVKMTQMPELVALMHSLVGLAAVLIGYANYIDPAATAHFQGAEKTIHELEIYIGVLIGAVTFSGSLIAFGKLSAKITGKPVLIPARHWINLAGLLVVIYCGYWFIHSASVDEGMKPLAIMTAIALAFGVHMVMAIGGADMPVVVSMLNSYSGWAAAGIGFTLQNNLLIVTGALVGSSGAILSYIMCRGMNRSIINVILGGFGGEANAAGAGGPAGDRAVKQGSAEDAAFVMKNARSVIIVPGYGMAVAQAQHALREMSDLLKKEGVEVRYAIHPVAGRMPGHMNVLLAEANVPYDEVFELEEINRDFAQADVAFVIGANDVTNPAAKSDPASPIYGMPILDVENAKTVLFVKRSMASGYAGVENELFFRDNTLMLFGDAKKMCEDVAKILAA